MPVVLFTHTSLQGNDPGTPAGWRPVRGDPMRGEDAAGNELTDLGDWENLHEPDKWKPGRSAHSAADFVVNHRGADSLRRRFSAVLGEPVGIRRLVPEHEIRFDRYGRVRFHDIGIYGNTVAGRSLFVGVEAKVDETFCEYVGEEWRRANNQLRRGENAKKPCRMRELCKMFGSAPGITEDSSEIRYELLHGVAGTIDAEADASVFYIAVFRTQDCDVSIGEANRRDYLRFIECAGGEPVGSGGGEASAHLLTLDDSGLVSIYEYFDVD